jgi:putative ABC transport system permease protein
MRISLAAGRAFTRADDERAPLVAVVNEAAARRFWPGTNAVGRRFRFNGASEGWREVIGVVRDVRHWGLARAANPEVYLPVRQDPSLSMTYVLATRLEPGSIAGEVRSAVRRIDAELVVSNLRSMRTVAAESVQAPRAALVLLGLFGLVALVLASAGIYGVVAHLVTLRTSEIGIRVALGARPRTVTWLILRDGVLPTVAGLAIGLGGAVVVMRSVRASLYEVSPVDPLTFASVAVLLLAAAGLACVLPVRRALRVDPIAALRAE